MNPHQKPQEDVEGLIAKLCAEADNPDYMAGDGTDWCQVNAVFLREVADTLQRTYEAGRRDMREAAAIRTAYVAGFEQGWEFSRDESPSDAAESYAAGYLSALPTEPLGGEE